MSKISPVQHNNRSFENVQITVSNRFETENKRHHSAQRGSQWTGRSSVEMYRQVLLTGCRCIELDVVDSERKNDEPEIKHKNTPVRPVLFIEVIVAIKEYAFKVTPYPLILSIENHCGPKAQAKMAQYFVDVFGEYLITEPLKTHPCEEHYPLPSPHDLKYKILIKNKKLNPNLTSKLNNENNRLLPRKQTTTSTTSSSDQSIDMSTVSSSSKNLCHTTLSDESTKSKETLFEQMSPLENHQQLVNKNPRHCVLIDDGNSSDDGTDISEINSNEYQSSTNDRYRESKATKAMSDLVHYIVPVRFKTFALAEERNRSYEISSFSEEKAYNLIREQAKEFLAYNQRQLCRIYPRGTRLDSSNYNPYIYWPIGCQMCALNYQTLDAAMQLNLGLFSFNNGCGYIEKPSALCQSKSSFDPRIRMNVENVAGYQIYIKVISGQFLCQDREPTFVDIQMYGMYGDANKRNEFLVRAKRWNGFQAIYDDIDIDSNKYSIRFPNVTLPEMAALRFVVSTEDGTLLGQSFIPIAHIRPGYRYVVLRNQMNIPIHSSSLLIFIQINVHIKAEDQDFANKLVEPLKDQTKDLNKSNQDSNNEKNQYNDIFSKMLIRNHSSFPIQQENTSTKRSETTTSSDETNWYQKHLIAASRLHDRKTLCKVLSFNDIISKEVVKRDEKAEYTTELRKPCIPCLMQPRFRPYGWLGIIKGAKIHVDFATLPFEEAFALLIREIETIRRDIMTKNNHNITQDKTNQPFYHQHSVGFTSIDKKNIDNELNSISPSGKENNGAMDWDAGAVKQWLERIGLLHLENALIDIDGKLLFRLHKMKQLAANSYYKFLDKHFDRIQTVRMSDTLNWSILTILYVVECSLSSSSSSSLQLFVVVVFCVSIIALTWSNNNTDCSKSVLIVDLKFHQTSTNKKNEFFKSSIKLYVKHGHKTFYAINVDLVRPHDKLFGTGEEESIALQIFVVHCWDKYE
ncbi:unnamed protein product [Rotaria sordida]|uniref:Phosphoinositide phospholipase C n=1 Tax=Rotaria sordida TaxID=392033 RepID=A0A813WVU6_9BILA|nr:unnamed protein product [Rotaria sordida]